ncbi:putative outer membrane starch-binding protein [Mucilaginibacter yixingensis]|uniref:Putative outer membrane starch-binding protein n=1 Tax=Mucilaginibacter yixingensis TaxID=1295612 RepID=A0A2T5JBN5_9SPHI|nr:RagB/SusD family nutrient uptake outer membrane protein [Mucilaginibacter yixingensis]PTQ98287.1 putative outer membrane starch-binding protein [Mucilaginibacter yixingensis]
MNKKIYILLLATATIFGCKKQLDQQPVSSLATTNFFTNNNDFLQGVNGVYAQLKSIPDQFLWLGEMRSDNINAISDGNRDWDGINNFSPNITTVAFISNAWKTNYNGIFNANTVLKALTDKSSVIGNASLVTRYTAECRYLRAFYYFQLLRLFGGVPVISSPLTADEVKSVARGSVADVYTLIIGDLQYAAANLPASYTGSDVGRATSYAAKGLLGLVYLTRSGPTYNVAGPGLASNEYDKALAQFNDIIAGNQYSFLSDYTSIFSYANEDNKEVIFDVQYASSINGAGFPSDLVPVAYWTSLGISNTYGNGYGSSSFAVTNNLKTSYTSAGTDKRYAFNVATTYTSPFLKKYIDLTKKGTSGTDWPINFILLRYTDILLMKAECILHGAAGTQADVDGIVNQVRTRAGLGSLANVNLATLMEERRREFAGEGLRWNDLVREGLAVDVMNAWIKADAVTNVSQVVPNYVIYPVPAAEIQTKAGLYTQNPGYN